MKTVLSRRSFFITIAAIPVLSPLASAAGVAAPPPCLDIPEGWCIAAFGGRTSFPTTKRIADVYFCDPEGVEFRVAQVRIKSLPELSTRYPARVCHPHVYRSLRIRQALGRRDPVIFGEDPRDAYINTYNQSRPLTTRATADEVQGWTRIRSNERFEDRSSDGTVSKWDQALFVNPSDPMDIRAVRIPRERR